MKMEDLEASRLTEEEMSDVAGGRVTRTGHMVGATPKPTSTYIVQPRDSLSGIAQQLGVSVAELIKWNVDRYPGLKTDQRIKAGWELKYYER